MAANRPSIVFVLLATICTATTVAAKDYFLTIGGGSSPGGNQVSLEKNVLFFQRLLSGQQLADAPHDLFFSDGNDPHRDLQFASPDFDVPEANRLLASVFSQEKGLRYQYRNHQLPGRQEAATRANLERWFREVGAKLAAGDRLIVYLTGHGGKGNPTRNSHFYLWSGERMSVADFVEQLDTVPGEVPVVAVMVQCYSGGFANIVFNDGDPEQGVASAPRCGFFATVEDRVAAGCTADIREENYHEYSSYFWAAIGGEDRLGAAVTSPDYDGDGAVSFAEAHAYALIHSPTIDISVKTSDALLRAYSKTEADGHPDLLTAESPYELLWEHATPAERAVLDGLSEQLALAGPDRAAAARQLAKDAKEERKPLDTRKREAGKKLNGIRASLRKTLMARWPELASPWHPSVAGILATEGGDVVAVLQSHSQYSRFVELRSEIEQLSKQTLDLDRRWVKCQRLLRTLENVALAANLSHFASPEVLGDYQRLCACEAAGLHQPADLSPAIAATADVDAVNTGE